MRIKFYGTRGSVPISSPDSVGFGGNTTCLRIESCSLPDGLWLVVDAGTGIVPLGMDAWKQGIQSLTLLSTHWHHDHTQGMLLCPLTFIKPCQINWYGPEENGMGPREVLQALMKPPMFPVSYVEVASHFSWHKFDHPGGMVLAIHPVGGVKTMTVEELERFEAVSAPQMPFGKKRYSIEECLIVRMLKTNHPERTVSYRFEERTTGKVLVVLTDHENTDALPKNLAAHLHGADLLVMDAQYPKQKYETMTAGFGHGTPEYCAETAIKVGAKRLGLTHHDPFSTDVQIEALVAAAVEQTQGAEIEIFACKDYMEVEV